MVMCGKHTHIEGLFPVILKTKQHEFEWYILTYLYICRNFITVYEPETKKKGVFCTHHSYIFQPKGVTSASRSSPTL